MCLHADVLAQVPEVLLEDGVHGVSVHCPRHQRAARNGEQASDDHARDVNAFERGANECALLSVGDEGVVGELLVQRQLPPRGLDEQGVQHVVRCFGPEEDEEEEEPDASEQCARDLVGTPLECDREDAGDAAEIVERVEKQSDD